MDMSFKDPELFGKIVKYNLYEFIDALWTTYHTHGYVTKQAAIGNNKKTPTIQKVRDILKQKSLTLTIEELDIIIDDVFQTLQKQSPLNDRFLGFYNKFNIKTQTLTENDRRKNVIADLEIPKLCPIAFALPNPRILKKPKPKVSDPDKTYKFFGKYIGIQDNAHHFIDHKANHYMFVHTEDLVMHIDSFYILDIINVTTNIRHSKYYGIMENVKLHIFQMS